jgi:hypothetical protein
MRILRHYLGKHSYTALEMAVYLYDMYVNSEKFRSYMTKLQVMQVMENLILEL